MLSLHSRQLPLQLSLLIQTHLASSTSTSNGLGTIGIHSRRLSSVLRTGHLTSTARYATLDSIPHDGIMDRDSPPPPPPPNPFPYPKNANPTPHQIFHLNMGASQAEIKARYYDLVRTHHPDSFHTRLIHPSEAHARFRSIQAAYDFLRGRTLSPNPNASPSPSPNNFDPYMHELARRRRAHYASRQGYDTHNDRPGWGAGFGAPASERDDWNGGGRKERVILFFGVMSLMAGLFPNLPGTLVSTFVPTSLLPSSVFPFSLFASSTLPSSASSGSPDSPPSPSPSPPRPDSTQASPDPSSSRPFVLPFALDLDKSHRAAASALSQARRDARDMGVERREGVRKRVKEMEVDAAAVENAQDCDDAGHELRSNGSGSVGASGEEPGIVQAGAQTTVAGSESARKDSAP